MDVRIEAAPMVAKTQLVEATAKSDIATTPKVISLVEWVASFSCPTLGSHSISAVAPDSNFNDRRIALGAAA